MPKEFDLTYRQAAFVLNVSEDRILHEFIKYHNLTPIPTKFPGTQTEVEIKKKRNKAIKVLKGVLWHEQRTMSTQVLSEVFGLNVAYLIENINAKFWRDPVCVEYLEKHFARKILPNKKTGLLPEGVYPPAGLMAILTYENKMLMEKWFYKKYGGLVNLQGQKINIKLKY